MQYRPSDYRHIAAWGRYLGSYQYYIKDQQEQAALDNAPLDAVYYNNDQRRWVTLDEMAAPARQWLQECLK